ncbi:MAG TPA: FAD-dependent oxidoreductase, partial [Pirellulales bacterium]|nr:FAD-dependent oxidoreductase [Pirellulales bacterium]
MQRRDFLNSLGFAGYSLFVFAGDEDRLPAAEVSTDDLRRELARVAPPEAERRPSPREPHMALVELEADVFIAGGGMAGVCAAVAAARHGAKVVLVQDRSRLGGNASSEVKMHIVGANHHGGRPGWREGGLLEEFRLDDAVNNPQRCWELWDLLLYDKCKSEPNITLLLDTVLFAVDKQGDRISGAYARCDKTEHMY